MAVTEQGVKCASGVCLGEVDFVKDVQVHYPTDPGPGCVAYACSECGLLHTESGEIILFAGSSRLRGYLKKSGRCHFRGGVGFGA